MVSWIFNAAGIFTQFFQTPSDRKLASAAAETKTVVGEHQCALKENVQPSYLWLWGQSSTSCTSWTPPGICGRKTNGSNNTLWRTTAPRTIFLLRLPSCHDSRISFSLPMKRRWKRCLFWAVYTRINMRCTFCSREDPPPPPLHCLSMTSLRYWNQNIVKKLKESWRILKTHSWIWFSINKLFI